MWTRERRTDRRARTGPANEAAPLARRVERAPGWRTVGGLAVVTGVGLAALLAILRDTTREPAPMEASERSAVGGRAGSGASRPLADAADSACAPRADDALVLDSLPWPVDSAQALRRATLALQGGSALQVPVRVTRFERSASRIVVGLAADVEPRLVMLCQSGEVALHPNGVTRVLRRVTARAMVVQPPRPE